MDAKKALTMFSTPLTKCFKVIARMLADFLSFFSCQDEGIQRCNLSVIVPEENKVVSWVLYFIQFSQTSQTVQFHSMNIKSSLQQLKTQSRKLNAF